MSTEQPLIGEWETFSTELTKAQESHNHYLKLLHEVDRLQSASSKTVQHLNHRIHQLQLDIKRINGDPDSAERLDQIKEQMNEAQMQLNEMSQELPASDNGLYLSIIIGGNLNISLLNADARLKYKENYETFKLNVTYAIIAALTFAYFVPYRTADAICNFLMVWYYCTLTVREAILRVNGSRIKGWWVTHHYLACVLCGIALTMRDSQCYKDFRPLFFMVSFYVCALQIMQYRYQTGCLRRLHSLGQRYAMDVTVEGFSSWMFKGLSFMLPFLVIGYLLQGYCAYFLFRMHLREDCSGEWQVLGLAILFAVISFGNLWTILSVFIRKALQKRSGLLPNIPSKYRPKIA